MSGFGQDPCIISRKLILFLMKEMKGKANPASVREALLAEVEKRK